MGVLREALEAEMALRGFAPRTREVYASWMSRLVREMKLPADQITEQQVRGFLSDLSKRGRSASTMNQAICALRFFFREVLRCKWELELRYQRAPQRVPVTLTREEMVRLLGVVDGLRERAAMEIAYASGLRLDEVMHLKLTDIDSGRMILRVDQGKGKKDRNVMLSAMLLKTLRAYWKESKPRVWLFPGRDGKSSSASDGDPACLQGGEGQGADHEACELPFPAPQLRHASPRVRRQRERRSRLCSVIGAWARPSATSTWLGTT